MKLDAASSESLRTEHLLSRNVKRFRGGLVFKAHRRVYHSTLGLRVSNKEAEEGSAHFIKKKKKALRTPAMHVSSGFWGPVP